MNRDASDFPLIRGLTGDFVTQISEGLVRVRLRGDAPIRTAFCPPTRLRGPRPVDPSSGLSRVREAGSQPKRL